MSYDVMIIGCSKDGQPLFQLDPVWWWDSDELMEDDRFTMKQETSSYTDFEADFTLTDMRQLHERFRPAVNEGVFEGEKWQENIQPVMKALDTALYKQARVYHHFHVTVYEWESGLQSG